MEKILLLVDRGSKLTRQLLLFGRKEPLEVTEIDMNATVDGLLSMIDNLIRSNIVVTAVLDPHLWRVRADKGNIEQLLMNLFVNANDAMPSGGELFIKTANVVFDKEMSKSVKEARARQICNGKRYGQRCRNGEGRCRAYIRPVLYDQRAKRARDLALSVIYGIANRHGGMDKCRE